MNCSLSHICVLIPARNEETLLPECLRSVRAAAALLPASVRFDIIVAVDSSIDNTWDIARVATAERGAAIRTDAGTVGRARACAARLALDRYSGPLHRCWLANTDADCVVPADWLLQQVDLAARGIDIVAGTIDVNDFREHQPVVEERFRQTYLIRPDGSHPHVHGANLGIRANIYLEAGGWSDLATGEDHDLWKRATRLQARHASVDSTRVLTSGRRIARAPLGFAAALAAHNESVA